MDTSPSAIAKAFDAPMRFDKVLQAALSNNCIFRPIVTAHSV
jgi:hypothetical protein|tara:strand:- start:216 stop:341 length:126 start_codon:yes stop_codon:yes gene_type:complete